MNGANLTNTETINRSAVLPKQPLVSIGMYVYNSELTLNQAIESILTQDYVNIELIISDNASTDKTEKICRSFAKTDSRIKYFRNKQNLGPYSNLQFVLSESKGEYFMWAAGDDIRTSGFISSNLGVLLDNPSIVASTSPNVLGWEDSQNNIVTNFALLGNKKTRFRVFFENAGNSHGLFYSIMRSEVIKAYKFSKDIFFGIDWHIILFLANHGEINRTNSELTNFGTEGVSTKKTVYKLHGLNRITRILPFFIFSKRVLILIKKWPKRDFLYVSFLLLKLNLKTFVLEYRTAVQYLLRLRTVLSKKNFTVKFVSR
jgi:glycosyltransferase involved in cell wall biosynthesis